MEIIAVESQAYQELMDRLQRIEQYGYEVNKFQHSTRVLFDAVGVQFDDGTDELSPTSYDVRDDADDDFGEF